MTHPERWEHLAEKLTLEMLRMADGDTVILSSGDRFVQFQQHRDHLNIEAVSNEFLPPDHQLSSTDEQLLQTLGWQPPEPSLGFVNWRHSEEWPLRTATAQTLAQRLISTLRDVLKVDNPHALQARRFTVPR